MEVKRVCTRCGEVNEINANSLKKADVHDEYKKYYKVMYFDCKRCGERTVVQVDSFETLKTLKKLKGTILNAVRANVSGRSVSRRDQNRKDRLTIMLREQRERLEESCSGKKLFDEDEKVFIEQLTFPKDGDIIDSNM